MRWPPRPNDKPGTAVSQIPTLDITRFDSDREAFVAELGAAYRQWGFAGIRNHGIPQADIDAAYDAFKAFFALPEEVKRKYHVAGSGGARGYTPFGVETAKGSKHFDLKEFWHIGREIADDSKYRDVMAPNLWPTEVEGFRERGYGLYQALDNLGSRVLSALALHIGLPENFFADKTNFGNSILRPIHYPPITTDDIPNVRATPMATSISSPCWSAPVPPTWRCSRMMASGCRSPRTRTPSWSTSATCCSA